MGKGGRAPRPARMPAAADIPEIFRALIRHKVDYLVIGGVAVVHYGYVRTTKDLDIVPDPSPANLRRLWAALEDLDAAPLALQHFRPEELPEPLTLESLLKHGNWDLATKHGRLDIMQFINGKVESADDYTALAQASEETTFALGVVRFVGYGDLLDLKTIAGRDQDLLDLRALQEARGNIGPA